MKKIKIITFIIVLFIANLIHAQIENVIVETYYISTATDSIEFATAGGTPIEIGTKTYRVFIDLAPGCKLKKIYGDANHILKFSSTTPFFNNVDGLSFAKDFLNLNAHKNPTSALDTWLTIGQTTKTIGGKTNYGILKSQDRNGTTILTSNISLTNTAIPISLTTSDGMDTIAGSAPTSWLNAGFITIGGGDSTIFGSTKIRSEFISNNAVLQNSGVRGVIVDSNQVLIAQLSTKGDISFEINLEVEELIGGIPTVVKYVANDSILLGGEKYSAFLKYPASCGCKDPRFIEYSNEYSCVDSTACQHLIVYGCMDTMACNFDPRANYSVRGLCCYPGSCGGRELTTVCPSINGDSFDFEIFPNPTTENIFLNTQPGNAKQISYSVFDSFGVLKLTKDLGTTTRVINEEIDLSNLNSGLYLIRLDFDSKFSSKLFLKN